MSSRSRLAVAAAATAIAALALTGCSSTPEAKPSAAPTLNVPKPISVAVDGAASNGKQDVKVAINRVLVLGTVGVKGAGYTAKFSDPAIVQYVDGYSADGGKTFTPGLIPLKQGSTDVTLTQGSKTLQIHVTVTGAQ
jgi:hypothetical protein